MLAVLAMMREKYGSAEDYVRTVCGLTAEEIESIRRALIVHEVQTLNGKSHGAVL